MNEAKLPSLAAVCEVMIDAMRRAEQTPKEESKMTDHKLPPLPASARTTRDPMSNEFVRYWTAEQMHAHWLDGYRAGQSSAEPITREKAAELALDHCTRPDLSTRFEVIKGGKFATWLIEAIIEASRRAPALPERSLEASEKYRMQMVGVCMAAEGRWKESDSIHPDYDTPALREVVKLYAKYAELRAAASAPSAGEQSAQPKFDVGPMPHPDGDSVRRLRRPIDQDCEGSRAPPAGEQSPMDGIRSAYLATHTPPNEGQEP